MKQKKLIKWFGMFLALMVLFTFLSRGADSINVAKVHTKGIQNQIITHKVTGSGKVAGTRERAVFAKESQKVEQAMVQEGDSVKAGDELIRLSLDTLAQVIKEKEGETEELRLKVGDLESKSALEGEKKSSELMRAEENYNVAVSNGDINIANAEMEVNVARQKLQNYYNSQLFSDGGDTATEQALLDEIRSREEALNQVIMARNQEVLDAERQVEDARLAEASDGSLDNARRELSAAEEELAKLKELSAAGGVIRSPVDGVVKSISAVTGTQTSQEAALILYENAGELRMSANISRDDVKYVEAGDTVKLENSRGKDLADGQVENIRGDEKEADLFVLSIRLPEQTAAIGETVNFTASRDEGPYTSCIPVSALREEDGRTYVFVTDKQDSVLGEIDVARRVEVTVKDKNESLAALNEGALSTDQRIIVESDREITDGSRVRLQDS